MAARLERELLSSSPKQTAAIAGLLATAMRVPVILHLQGGLGTGKTLFARGFLRSLGVRGIIPSPSFSLAEIYTVGRSRYGHFDFFRCAGGGEWLAAGLAEDMENLDACLIEWPENADALPDPDAVLSFATGIRERQRLCVFRALSSAGDAWAERF